MQLVTQVATTFFVMALIGASIALPAGVWVIGEFMSYADLTWPSERGFNVFFNGDASDTQIASTAHTIENHALVSTVISIPKDVALEEFLTAAHLPDLGNWVEENPLPNALTVIVKDSIHPREVSQLTQFIRELEPIDQVSFDPEMMVRFNAIQSIFNRMLWIVSGVFCAFALFVSASAVRIAIQSRLHEIRIWHVIGSPRRVIRGPFLWGGAMYGLLGGIFAAVLLSLALMYLEEPLSSLTASYGVSRNLGSLEWSLVGIIIALGAVLGLSSAFYSTWRHIHRVTANWEI